MEDEIIEMEESINGLEQYKIVDKLGEGESSLGDGLALRSEEKLQG